jgi:hypothetical protein
MTPPAQAAPAPAQNFAGQNGGAQFDPNEYVTGAQFNQALGQAQQSLLNPMLEANAQLAWQMAKQEPEAKAVFDRFGPEALQYWQRLPANQRTLDGARMVVKLVKGNHFEELAADAIARVTGDVSFRSGTGGAPPGTNYQPPLERDEIPEQWRTKAKSLGLEVDDMKKFCEANGLTMDQYFAKYINKTVGAK